MLAFAIPNVPDPAPPPQLSADVQHDGMGGVEFRLNGFPVFGVGADGRGTHFTIPADLGLDLDGADRISLDLA